MTGDGQRRGARRDDGVSLSDERGLKNGFGKPLCNESAGDKGTCSRAPEDLGEMCIRDRVQTIARLSVVFGENSVAETPFMRPFSQTHFTAS